VRRSDEPDRVCRRRKPRLDARAERLNRQVLALVGQDLRASRLRRHLSQAALAARVGLSQPTVSRMERGEGGTLSVDVWQRVAIVVDRSLSISLGRDPLEEPADGGHLIIQELVLRLAKKAGYEGTFELPGHGARSLMSTDIGLRHPKRLVLVECVNTFGDIGAAVRSSDRKRRDAGEVAVALGGETPLAVHSCWVVRATRRNREIVATYPELFASRFPARSVDWVSALTKGVAPPSLPGLVWCDVGATRLLAWRVRR
jgi:transcriptional regulator with XRE-family HTH domain